MTQTVAYNHKSFYLRWAMPNAPAVGFYYHSHVRSSHVFGIWVQLAQPQSIFQQADGNTSYFAQHTVHKHLETHYLSRVSLLAERCNYIAKFSELSCCCPSVTRVYCDNDKRSRGFHSKVEKWLKTYVTFDGKIRKGTSPLEKWGLRLN